MPQYRPRRTVSWDSRLGCLRLGQNSRLAPPSPRRDEEEAGGGSRAVARNSPRRCGTDALVRAVPGETRVAGVPRPRAAPPPTPLLISVPETRRGRGPPTLVGGEAPVPGRVQAGTPVPTGFREGVPRSARLLPPAPSASRAARQGGGGPARRPRRPGMEPVGYALDRGGGVRRLLPRRLRLAPGGAARRGRRPESRGGEARRRAAWAPGDDGGRGHG